MHVFRLPQGTPTDRGRAHGEHFRDAIHEIAEIRMQLALDQGSFANEAALLEVARAHLPVTEAFDAPLSEELRGIAEGADLDLGRLVVLNHYTDLKDIQDEECTSAAVDGEQGSIIGQTWDMHGSVQPYVCMLDLGDTWVFTITGCLALAGMSVSGVSVCINNLKSHDAKVGVLWPALVRRMLQAPDTASALAVLNGATMSSGHHYLFTDGMRTVGVETSGERKDIVLDRAFGEPGDLQYVHTNHCLSESIGEVSWVSEWSTSFERFAWLDGSARERRITGRRDLWQRFGSHVGYPRSLCTHLSSEEKPHAMKTCGAVIMDPGRGELWAHKGCMHEAEPTVYRFERGTEEGTEAKQETP